jgi:hypothetical protein
MEKGQQIAQLVTKNPADDRNRIQILISATFLIIYRAGIADGGTLFPAKKV